MTWGTELWDQFDNIAGQTQKGIDFCEKYSHFIKERCAIENEYAAKLKKLVKSYQPKKPKADDEHQFTIAKGFMAMLNEIHDMAGQHEVVSENLTTGVLRELTMLASELKQERKKHLQEGGRQSNSLQAQLAQLERVKKQYEKTFREAEKAYEAYRKADADIHLSRADVEKAKNLMMIRRQTSESCKSDYAAELQKTNQHQTSHFQTVMPQVYQTLQDMEERRINRTKEFIKQSGDIERNVVPIINTCIDGIMKAAETIDASKDTRLVVEKYKSGFQLPTDIPFEDLSNANLPESQNNGQTPKNPPRTDSMRSTVSGSKGKKRAGFFGIFSGAKTDDTKDDFSHLPPNQQKKQLLKKLDMISAVITKETAERDGMLKMRDVYVQNPALGDPASLDKQLEENAQKLDKLRQEQQKYEHYMAEADERNASGKTESGNDSMPTRVSNISISSQNQSSSNPSTPSSQRHAPVGVDSPDSVETIRHVSEQDSFDDLDDVIGSCIALYPFEAADEGSIPMDTGETLSIVEKDQGDGWTRVRRANGDEGFVPTSYLECHFD